jgi:hypothetical protein
MPRVGRLGSTEVGAALALALALASPAFARKFQMSGTWIVRNGGVFVPIQFAFAGMDMSGNTIHASMGNLTGAFGFPNGPVPGAGGVTATGSAPATLRIPPHRFVEDAMFLLAHPGTGIAQITTNFGIDAPYAAATLAPGGGPGSFTWCPQDPACVAGGGMRSTDPPQGAGRNGRVIYRAGANRFGGAMQLGLRRGGRQRLLLQPGSLPGGAPPLRERHAAPVGGGRARLGGRSLHADRVPKAWLRHPAHDAAALLPADSPSRAQADDDVRPVDHGD